MIKNYILLFSIALFLAACGPKKEIAKTSDEITYARILFYNVENLFDTLDAEGKSDAEYTPGSEKNWNTEKYYHKLSQLSKVIAAADTGFFPELIALSEIENAEVVLDLAKTDLLKDQKYQLIHQESPDQRGIDVALMHTNKYSPLYSEFVLVDLPGARTNTRDILYSKGVLYNDTVHLFVNHWPSRYGGKEKSDPKRAFTAAVLREKVDSIQKSEDRAQIIIMGDFNDYPADSSLSYVLAAKESLSEDPDELVNLAWKAELAGKGSYNYKGHWGCLDQFIVSGNLFSSNLKADYSSYIIVKKEWMLYTNKKGEQSPSRTYGGKNHYGGYSDHLPVLLKLEMVKD